MDARANVFCFIAESAYTRNFSCTTKPPRLRIQSFWRSLKTWTCPYVIRRRVCLNDDVIPMRKRSGLVTNLHIIYDIWRGRNVIFLPNLNWQSHLTVRFHLKFEHRKPLNERCRRFFKLVWFEILNVLVDLLAFSCNCLFLSQNIS